MSRLSEYIKANKKEVYSFATKNTSYNSSGQPIIKKNDDWRAEKEWDTMYKELKGAK